MKIIVLDLETKELVRDWSEPWEAGLACLGLWCSWKMFPYGRYFLFDMPTLCHGIDLIQEADLVVTYNGLSFDGPFLDGLWSEEIQWPDHCDLWEIIRKALGWRKGPRLEAVARPTLGWGKTAHGRQAPEMFQQRRFAELHTYQVDDLTITRALYYHIRKWGFVWVDTGAGVEVVRLQVPGSWRMFDLQGSQKGRPATPAQLEAIRKKMPWWEPPQGFSFEAARTMLERR